MTSCMNLDSKKTISFLYKDGEYQPTVVEILQCYVDKFNNDEYYNSELGPSFYKLRKDLILINDYQYHIKFPTSTIAARIFDKITNSKKSTELKVSINTITTDCFNEEKSNQLIPVTYYFEDVSECCNFIFEQGFLSIHDFKIFGKNLIFNNKSYKFHSNKMSIDVFKQLFLMNIQNSSVSKNLTTSQNKRKLEDDNNSYIFETKT